MNGLIGRRLGRYEVVSLLGAGGMGEVYRARDTELERDVAVKVLPDAASGDPAWLERFRREARALSRLSHPNILEIFDAGSDDGIRYVVTELLEGRTLRDHLEHGRLPIRKAVAIADAISRGLGAAHAQGVVHRDVKPENVLLTLDGRVKVLDFGIASLHEPEPAAIDVTEAQTVTSAGTLLGTIGYMAPEQVRGEAADARSDVFALGCVLYEMLTGRRAFERATPAATLAAIMHEEPEPPGALVPDLPSSLARVVMRCLEKEPGERFQSAADVAFALRAAEESRGHRPAARRRKLDRRLVASAILGAAVVIAAGLTWRHFSIGPPRLPEKKHVAVMRFHAQGNDTHLELFAVGLSQYVASSMALLEEQTRGTVWLAEHLVEPEMLSKEQRLLGVTVGVSGRLRRDQSRLQLTLATLAPATGEVLRETEIDDLPGNLSALQTEPVLRLANLLGVELTQATLARLRGRTTNVWPAFDDYVTGLGLLDGEPPDDQLSRAVDKLHSSVNLDPLFWPARTALAHAYLRRYRAGKEESALSAGIEQAVRATQTSDYPCEAFLTLAELHEAAGKNDERATVLERASRVCPDNARVSLALGHAYKSLGRPDDAERQYQRAIYLRPGYWPGYHWLAVLYLSQGATEAAATEFRHVIESAPDNYKGYNNLAYTYDQLGLRAESLAALEHSVELEPKNNPVAFVNLGKLHFDDARFGDAAALFQRALALRPGDYLTWGNLAYSYASGVDLDRVEEAARKAIRLAETKLEENPNDPSLLCYLAGYHALVSERQRGVQLLETAVKADPQDPKIIGNIAGTWEDLGDRDRALEWVERAFARGVPPSRFENRPLLRGLVADPRFQTLVEKRAQPAVREKGDSDER